MQRPIAGLHFTNELLDKIREKGVQIVEVYLTVGLGTFRPVKVDYIKDHIMHKRRIFCSKKLQELLIREKKIKKNNSSRNYKFKNFNLSLDRNNNLISQESSTDIFIYGD